MLCPLGSPMPYDGDAAAPAAETPFKRFFARLDGVVSSQKDGVGRMLVRGVPQPEDSDDDHDDAEDEATRAKLTDEDMAHMRFIVITKGRAEQLKAMQRLLLGEQAGDSMLCFNTSFSYHIMSAYATFSRCKVVGAAERFDALLGFTANLGQYDVWVHDHEVGWGGHRFLADLARQWRELLALGDSELGIDGEFTRAGVEQLLGEFQATVEQIEQVDEPPVYFRFRAADFDAEEEEEEMYKYVDEETSEEDSEGAGEWVMDDDDDDADDEEE